MGARLDAEDAAHVLAATARIWPPGPDFRAAACGAVRDLVRCDLVMFNRADLESGQIDYVVEPVRMRPRAVALHDLVLGVGLRHPVVGHYLEGRPDPTMRVTDEVGPTEWLESEVYRELLEPLGVRWQMVQIVPSVDGFLSTVSVSRYDEDFSDRDVAVLDALAPTFALGCGGVPSAV